MRELGRAPSPDRLPLFAAEKGANAPRRLGPVLLPLALLVLTVGTLSLLAGPSETSIFARAARKAVGGGISGAVAGIVQVLALMWLRTAMNFQYRHGGSLRAALSTLHAQGGVPRFYQGVGWALLNTPLARFGDTAANTGVLALLGALGTRHWMPIYVRTLFASAAAVLWRMAITPLDTLKTTLQVR